jgi:hypothetical protein
MRMTAYRYDAFLSYKSSSSSRAARRLVRHLLAISKRHRGEREPRIFYDQFSLPPGRLRQGLVEAVRAARHLVVLVDEEVGESEWVATEIREWRDAGGVPDRLFLVRTSREADLSWAGGGFADPGVLPEPLRDYFDSEQAYIDYPAWALTRPDDKLARLCATLVGADPRDYLVAEAEIQRRRSRRTTVVAAALALLAVASVFFGIRAVVNARAADRSAAEAFAQADAAEALLAAADAPTLGIERAVRAARTSDSPTVRSAMLAVSQEARRLRRALSYPEAAAGHPPATAAFSPDGGRLLAWGDGPAAGTSYLQVWDVATGRSETSGPVEVAGLTAVTRVNAQFAVACGDAGPVLLELAPGGARATSLGAADGVCTPYAVASGVVLRTARAAAYVDRRGRIARVEGVSTVAADPKARYALAAGESGSHVLRGGRWVRAGGTPAQARYADENGRFLSRLGATTWQFVEQGPDGPRARVVAVPRTAVDVVPVVDYSRFTGEVIWVDGSGTVGWSGGSTTTRVGDAEGTPGWRPYRTRLVALRDADAVVVYRNTATVVRSPGQDGRPGAASGWVRQVVAHRLGTAARTGDDPVAGRCRDGMAAFVRTDLPEGGALAVGRDGDAVELTSPPLLGGDCTAVDAGSHLDVLYQGPGNRIRLRDRLVVGSVLPSPDGEQVAVVQSGVPVQILSAVDETSLPRPWNVRTSVSGWPAGGGTRRVDWALGGVVLVADGAEPVHVTVPGMGSVVAVRPDGLGAAVTTSTGVALVEGDTVRAGAAECVSGRISYVPEPDFRRSAAAAAAQVPIVRRDDGTAIDCRTGRVLPAAEVVEVLQYDVGATAGVVVTRSGVTTAMTRWRPGSTPDTVDGPVLPSAEARLVVGERPEEALVYPPGGRRVSLVRRDGGRWTTVLDVVPNLPDVGAAALADGGTLLVAVGSRGGFELYDTAAGRLLASDAGVADFNADQALREAVTVRRGDDLFVYLFTAGFAQAVALVQIPVGVPALLTQLCGLYRAPDCPT